MQGSGRSPLLLLLDPRNSHFPVFPSIHTTGQNRKDMGGVASCRKCNQRKKLGNRKNYLRKGREGQVRPLKNGAKVSCLSLSVFHFFASCGRYRSVAWLALLCGGDGGWGGRKEITSSTRGLEVLRKLEKKRGKEKRASLHT